VGGWPREKFRKGMGRERKGKRKTVESWGSAKGVGGTEGVRPPAGHVKFIKLRGETESQKPKTERESRRRKLSAVRSATCQRVLPAAILRRNNRRNVEEGRGTEEERWP